MANVNLRDLARMTVSSSGTGTITLNAAVSGFLTFDLAGCSTDAAGEIVRYAIADTAQSETAYGTYTSSSLTLTRGSSTNGMKSTNTNSPINMSNAAIVLITPQARDYLWQNDTANTTATSSLIVDVTGQLKGRGTVTNDSAAAGYIGEFMSNTNLAVPLTSITGQFLTAVDLTAGDWDVDANAMFNPSATTSMFQALCAINTTIDAVPSSPTTTGGLSFASGGTVTGGRSFTVRTPTVRVSINALTRVYINVDAEFSVSTLTADGFISARRPR